MAKQFIPLHRALALLTLLTVLQGMSVEVTELQDPTTGGVEQFEDEAAPCAVTPRQEAEAYAQAKSTELKAESASRRAQQLGDEAQLAANRMDEAEEKKQTAEGEAADTRYHCDEISAELGRAKTSLTNIGNQLKQAEQTAASMKQQQNADQVSAERAVSEASGEYDKYAEQLEQVQADAKKARGAASRPVGEAQRKDNDMQALLAGVQTKEDRLRRLANAKKQELRRVEGNLADAVKTGAQRTEAVMAKLEEVKRLAIQRTTEAQSKLDMLTEEADRERVQGKEQVIAARQMHQLATEEEKQAAKREIDTQASAEKAKVEAAKLASRAKRLTGRLEIAQQEAGDASRVSEGADRAQTNSQNLQEKARKAKFELERLSLELDARRQQKSQKDKEVLKTKQFEAQAVSEVEQAQKAADASLKQVSGAKELQRKAADMVTKVENELAAAKEQASREIEEEQARADDAEVEVTKARDAAEAKKRNAQRELEQVEREGASKVEQAKKAVDQAEARIQAAQAAVGPVKAQAEIARQAVESARIQGKKMIETAQEDAEAAKSKADAERMRVKQTTAQKIEHVKAQAKTMQAHAQQQVEATAKKIRTQVAQAEAHLQRVKENLASEEHSVRERTQEAVKGAEQKEEEVRAKLEADSSLAERQVEEAENTVTAGDRAGLIQRSTGALC